MAGELGDGSGQLDAGWTPADDHERQHFALQRRRLGVFRLLEGEQQAAPDIGCILDLLQARRKRSPFIMPKVAVTRTGRDDQVVIRNTGVAR